MSHPLRLTEEEIANLWVTHGPGKYYGAMSAETYKAERDNFASALESAVLRKVADYLHLMRGDEVASLVKVIRAAAEEKP